jgi:serine/threonine protein kinase
LQEVDCQEKFIGTVPYASLEQFRQKNVNRSSDVWSFGCILMQLLSRQLPWQGETNEYTIYSRISSGQIPFELDETTPAESPFIAIARSCLHHDQQLRPTFSKLHDALRRISIVEV